MKTIVHRARSGNATSQLKLALHYIWGSNSFPKSERLARIWYKKGAVNGNVEAMFNLGTMCLEGEGGAVDVSSGLKWLKKAALCRKWHIFSNSAPTLLADIYGEGLFGVEIDAKESRRWRRLSQERQSKRSEKKG